MTLDGNEPVSLFDPIWIRAGCAVLFGALLLLLIAVLMGTGNQPPATLPPSIVIPSLQPTPTFARLSFSVPIPSIGTPSPSAPTPTPSPYVSASPQETFSVPVAPTPTP
jgi:hypothetical protein